MKTILIAVLTACLAISAEKAPKTPDQKSDTTVKVHISLGDLVIQSRPSLNKLFAFDLPVKTAWSLRKTVAVVEAEYKRFEEQRQALIKKHGKVENGSTTVPPDRLEAFSEDFRVLSQIMVDLNIEPVSISLLGDAVKLSASDMARLEPFLIP